MVFVNYSFFYHYSKYHLGQYRAYAGKMMNIKEDVKYDSMLCTGKYCNRHSK